jgi:hypothetical protein
LTNGSLGIYWAAHFGRICNIYKNDTKFDPKLEPIKKIKKLRQERIPAYRLPIGEIAVEGGFFDLKYFRWVFTEEFGCRQAPRALKRDRCFPEDAFFQNERFVHLF